MIVVSNTSQSAAAGAEGCCGCWHIIGSEEKSMVKRIRPLLDDLRQIAGFYLNAPLYDCALEIAGETVK